MPVYGQIPFCFSQRNFKYFNVMIFFLFFGILFTVERFFAPTHIAVLKYHRNGVY